jgi:transposase
LRAVDLERLIGEDHPARAIWKLVGSLDSSAFYRTIGSSEEEGGRPAFDPQLLISLWVYAYSLGIGSARRCEYDPAFQWLTGLDEVNHHRLADLRVEKQKELDDRRIERPAPAGGLSLTVPKGKLRRQQVCDVCAIKSRDRYSRWSGVVD